MIAVDTNLLVYAHRADSEFHTESMALVESLSAGTEAWAIPWPCVHEFLAIVTNPRIFKTPTPLATALATMRNVHDNSGAEFLAEGDDYHDRLESLATVASMAGRFTTPEWPQSASSTASESSGPPIATSHAFRLYGCATRWSTVSRRNSKSARRSEGPVGQRCARSREDGPEMSDQESV